MTNANKQFAVGQIMDWATCRLLKSWRQSFKM